MYPEQGMLYQGLRAKLLQDLGRSDEAVAAARALKTVTSIEEASSVHRYSYVALTLWRAGHRQEAADFCAARLDLLPKQGHPRGYLLTVVGRFDEALPYLEQVQPTFYRDIFWNTIFDPVRDDPRFLRLVDKLGITQEYRAARRSLARVIKEQEARK
jgi:tetratricopeptide (TPR) repeat protein